MLVFPTQLAVVAKVLPQSLTTETVPPTIRSANFEESGAERPHPCLGSINKNSHLAVATGRIRGALAEG